MRPAHARGLTLLGLLAALIPLVLVIILAMRIAPAYYEHQRISGILAAMADSGQTREASELDLRTAFDRRAEVEDIASVKGSDLDIDKSADEKVISVEYVAKVPLFQHVSLMIEFSASTRPVAGKP